MDSCGNHSARNSLFQIRVDHPVGTVKQRHLLASQVFGDLDAKGDPFLDVHPT